MSESEQNASEKSPTQKKMEARLKELDAQIQLFTARAERMQAEGQKKSMTALERLREQREAAARELEKYRAATGAALEKVGSGLKKAFDDLSRAVEDTARTFSDEKGRGSRDE